MISINKDKKNSFDTTIYLIDSINQINDLKLKDEEIKYFKKKIKEVKSNHLSITVFDKEIHLIIEEENLEKTRQHGNKIISSISVSKKVLFINNSTSKSFASALLEGFYLGSYLFNYFKKEKKIINIEVQFQNISKSIIEEVSTIKDAVFFARDLINLPFSHLTAVDLSNKIVEACEKNGCKTDVFGFEKIKSLKMGGLLAVNKGSIDPPTFTTISWKPKNPKNSQPIVFIGKGVVYDTGGLSLKSTLNSMDQMKSDMSGAAAVAGALQIISKLKLPIHVVGLIPATDNRPGGNAYTPGDVITHYDGTTVEVLNTDAEGRLILADAIAYAEKYNPSEIITIATLTGSAQRAFGTYASAIMGNHEISIKEIEKAGFETHERVAICPFWDDYKVDLKSYVADLKNIGGLYAGHITAGKFLEHFSKSPFIHLDIASMAYRDKRHHYISKGGSGVGVRLLHKYIANKK